jgi:hypothetical protein
LDVDVHTHPDGHLTDALQAGLKPDMRFGALSASPRLTPAQVTTLTMPSATTSPPTPLVPPLNLSPSCLGSVAASLIQSHNNSPHITPQNQNITNSPSSARSGGWGNSNLRTQASFPPHASPGARSPGASTRMRQDSIAHRKDSPNRVCCNALLSAYARARPPQSKRAAKVLQLMLKYATLQQATLQQACYRRI